MNTYKPKEFAKMGVSVKTLQRWDRNGTLVAHRTPTNRRYYTDDMLGRSNTMKDVNSYDYMRDEAIQKFIEEGKDTYVSISDLAPLLFSRYPQNPSADLQAYYTYLVSNLFYGGFNRNNILHSIDELKGE